MAARPSPEQQALLAWGRAVRRDLPWRATRDPWAVLVSEVMLQQTQAERVVARWIDFLERWPEPAALAATPLADVLVAWSGLGYPRRARDLHRSATILVERHGGRLPERLEELLALPGVGPYTARAVLAFAYEAEGVGVVDTNIARVLARRAGERLTPRRAQAEADAFVASGTTWEHNQSLMDLGALRCRPRPDCDGCPLELGCAWRLGGHPEPDPAAGSAGVSGRQAPFAGSDRQARGRLLAALAAGPLDEADLATAAGCPDDPARARRLADALVGDGLVHRDRRTWRLGGAVSPPGSRAPGG